MNTKPKSIEGNCPLHGTATYILEGRGYYRCKKCRVDAVQKRRRKCKELLVEYAGGECQACGYNEYVGAMDFHHPGDDKEFGIAGKGITMALDKMKAEADKCVLLCCRCHREVHAGIRECPPLRAGI